MVRASDPLLVGLLDDAALFPPGSAPMAEGLAAHAEYRVSTWADAVGPFLCPASRIDELLAVLAQRAGAVGATAQVPLALAMVLDVGGDGAHQALRAAATATAVNLVAVEVAYEHLGDDAAAVGANIARALPGCTGVLEVPRGGFDQALDLLGTPGWQVAKYRTGGMTADAFPTEAELAAFLVAATSRGVPFKLTAGLHHAVRHTTAKGFEAPGVLNVLVATRTAQAAGGTAEVAATLAERDADVLVEAVRSWDSTAGADVRRSLRSVGCCGVTEPLDDLRTLGLFDDGEL